MKFLSWDIGIKNLSYCWLDYDLQNKTFKILKWEIINLETPKPKQQTYTCMCLKKNKHVCLKKATWFQLGTWKTYCQTHHKQLSLDTLVEIKKNTCSHILPQKKERCTKKIKYQTSNPLIGYCEVHSKKYPDINLELVTKIKKPKYDLEETATNLIQELDNRKELLASDHILIENQPAFKNPKMKSIQMILYSYYLMKAKIEPQNNNINIAFLMANNKLKVNLETDELKNSMIQKIHSKTKDKYRRHKELSKAYTKWFLETNDIKDWLCVYEKEKKQDDMADTFLMCIYYYQNLKTK